MYLIWTLVEVRLTENDAVITIATESFPEGKRQILSPAGRPALSVYLSEDKPRPHRTAPPSQVLRWTRRGDREDAAELKFRLSIMMTELHQDIWI